MLRSRTSALTFILCMLIVSAQAQNGQIREIGNKLKAAAVHLTKNIIHMCRGIYNAASALVKGVSRAIPTPEAVFEISKNVLMGYPFEVVSTAIDKICSAAVASKIDLPRLSPDLDKINFQLRTATTNYSFLILKANEIWHCAGFDPKKKVVIFATGWTTTIKHNEAIDVLAKAYITRGDVNFVALDVAHLVTDLYSWSALNTDTIALCLSEGLMRLTDVVPVKNIHMIGHSLGAHIVGATGRYFNYRTGKLVPRITGLDPAKPCFNEGEVLSGLMRGDAEFVDVIHSNPGVLGNRDPLGDVDFYPGGLDPLSAGCLDIICAHARAWRYYAESVYPGSENNFMAKRCNSLTRLRQQKCPGEEYPMGYAVPTNLKGNYFSEVNGKAPFGKGRCKS